MSDPHRIFLKGPWICEWLAGPFSIDAATVASSDVAALRLHMPAVWQECFGNVTGKVRFTRRFQRPTNLTERHRVHIGFAGVGGAAVVSVNEHPIGGIRDNQQPISFDVTDLLQPSNMLTVDVQYDPSEHGPRGGLWAPVAVEIYEHE